MDDNLNQYEGGPGVPATAPAAREGREAPVDPAAAATIPGNRA